MGAALHLSTFPVTVHKSFSADPCRPSALLAFILNPSNAHSLPKRLLSPSIISLLSSTPISTHQSPSRGPLPPSHQLRRANFQGISIFDSATGSLSLCGCVISLRPIEQNPFCSKFSTWHRWYQYFSIFPPVTWSCQHPIARAYNCHVRRFWGSTGAG